MANYGYIDMCVRITPAFADNILRSAVHTCLDPRWQVENKEACTWLIFLPGTEQTGQAAVDAVLADGEPVGFMVELTDRGKRWSFRHGPNRFERWAQGRLEEQLADVLGAGVLYDATDEIRPPGTRWYRQGNTYREHMEHRFPKPLSDDDAAYIDRQMYCAPEGHR